MLSKIKNSFDVLKSFRMGETTFHYCSLAELEQKSGMPTGPMPVSLKILLENMLRHEDGIHVTAESIEKLLSADRPSASTTAPDVSFLPARVLLQDFTGVPAVVDLAAMRDAMVRLGGDPEKINPLVRSDLVIDHSIQADFFGRPDALQLNEALEYERNSERYSLLKWAQSGFRNFSVVPPGRGIVHQVNLEHLATVVQVSETAGMNLAYPDTLVGTDSHTTMINGLGVLGWGVGGIEAEAVMLGQPYIFPLPDVVGFRLLGALKPGVTATDLVLHITTLLRLKKVVGKFVEFFGPGMRRLSLPDRATIANMAPEYGATVGFFPVDPVTLDYLRVTGRNEDLVRLVEAYSKEQGLFSSDEIEEPVFADTLTLDLGDVEACLAGPKRPQDRIPLKRASTSFTESLTREVTQWGFGLDPSETNTRVRAELDGGSCELGHGSVVIAAVTSCTNTSNPDLMLAAGLVARKALDLGIRSKPWVKTSLAPGSLAVTEYLREAGLLEPLQSQGFHLVGYGCTTCIGNSGPLPQPVLDAIDRGNLVAAAVLSGNRNFEGRIHNAVRANYLASPPLVVAYALSGTMTIDFEKEPIDFGTNGQPVYLKDIWPTDEEIAALAHRLIRKDLYEENSRNLFQGGSLWRSLPAPEGALFTWDPRSTYIRRPPFLDELPVDPPPVKDILHARVLLLLGDSVTTDHISPAGAIRPESPAGRHLRSLGVEPADFNSYGSRRGNHEVMIRGTFANVRLRNELAAGEPGGMTRHFPSGEIMTVWDAAERYRQEGVPLVVLAGSEYGTGSSRDWAAKGTALLGVRAVIARSFERIHRSNLIGMGILPIQFPEGVSAASLGIHGNERFTLEDLEGKLKPGSETAVQAARPDGSVFSFHAIIRLDTPSEVDYYRHGGILPRVLRNLVRG